MPKQKMGDKLEAAIRAKAALDAEIKALQAEARERKRRDDERRFLIAGRAITAHLAEDPGGKLSHDIIALLDRAVTRPGDRKLFAFLGAAVGELADADGVPASEAAA